MTSALTRYCPTNAIAPPSSKALFPVNVLFDILILGLFG